jgi:hypothetical protein
MTKGSGFAAAASVPVAAMLVQLARLAKARRQANGRNRGMAAA